MDSDRPNEPDLLGYFVEYETQNGEYPADPFKAKPKDYIWTPGGWIFDGEEWPVSLVAPDSGQPYETPDGGM